MTNLLGSIKQDPRYEKAFFWLAIAFCLVLTTWAAYAYLPMGVDWYTSYQPASQQIFALQSPYNVPAFYNPPWALLPILPIALLPTQLGFAVNFSIGLAVTTYVAIRLGAKKLTWLLVVFSYPILFMVTYGQIDWIVYLGFLLPPHWGLFFVLIKPQASIGIVIFWFIELIRTKGIKQAVLSYIPVTLAFALSFLVFGNWLKANLSFFTGSSVNASLWPFSIPIGMALLISAIRQRRVDLALVASPFLSPYFPPHGWGTALLGLSAMPLELLAANIGLWILRFMTGYFLH